MWQGRELGYILYSHYYGSYLRYDGIIIYRSNDVSRNTPKADEADDDDDV
jgi:hypothetical protein